MNDFFISLQCQKMVSDLPKRLERKSLAIMAVANDKIWWCSFPVRNSLVHAFPHDYRNNGQRWGRNESCGLSNIGRNIGRAGIKPATSWSQVLYATDWAIRLSPTRLGFTKLSKLKAFADNILFRIVVITAFWCIYVSASIWCSVHPSRFVPTITSVFMYKFQNNLAKL